MANNLAPVIEELRNAFTALKAEVFDPKFGSRWEFDDKGDYVQVEHPVVELPMPIITVQARGRKHVDGWYKEGAWQSDAAEALNVLAGTGQTRRQIASNDEICVAAEALGKEKNELLTILTHQMVHHYSRVKYGTSVHTINENGYHKAEFERLASRVGLYVGEDGSRGMAKTQASPSLELTFNNIPMDMSVFDMYRKQTHTKERVGSKLKKWSCGCTNIRAAVFIVATCHICGNDFAYADKDREDVEVQRWLANSGYRNN